MSEITIIKCDGVGCESQVGLSEFTRDSTVSLAEVAENAGWIKDEFEADFCPACQERAKSLEENKASGDDLAAFGEMLGSEADKIEAKAQELGLEKLKEEPPAPPQLRDEAELKIIDERIQNMVKAMKKELKKAGKPKEFIDEAVGIFKANAAKLRMRA